MNNLQIARSLTSRNSRLTAFKIIMVKSYCKNNSDSEKDKTTDKATKKEETVNKLNLLLTQMVQCDIVSKNRLSLAKPKSRRTQNDAEPGTKSIKVETIEKRIVDAAKNVAEAIGGDKIQTESELLSKILNNVGKEDMIEPTNLSDIVKGMKIERDTKSPEAVSRAKQVKNILNKVNLANEIRPREDKPRRRQFRQIQAESISEMESIDLYGGKRLGIFNLDLMKTDVEQVRCETWNKLQDRQMRLAVTHPPANYFQQMILWTEQGKIWKFPIDNEQGLDEEQAICFTEHIFLEKHLESWCPTKGPIRHYMELVTVGLSKNPYLSVKDKVEHIEWYRQYFEDKKALLKEIGAIPKEQPEQLTS